ncbi:hypothetical protein J2752_000276 [Halarchaeum rubridurum]|uniref:Uncharacterized protein n=1 Tax=Halarchaeum rubridurum TaxID=489911 RepID=A0A830FNX6_9EURY|nr:hypothetical protein [Halarchaeum rubridurum]MBP1953395.1 hypothetical protein [Halarchaeum rubridurum]GGM65604.1 hypothetical protein GCM10009017_14630 [Halarchaeum rubridurum]
MTRNTRDRAQTTLDFAAGVSVFLLTVIFVFAFVPSLLAPATAPGAGNGVVADRVADDLARDELATETPYELSGPPTDGALAAARSNVSETLPPGTFLNLTLRTASAGRVVAADGPTPSVDAPTTASRRAVTAPDGTTYELRVVVW